MHGSSGAQVSREISARRAQNATLPVMRMYPELFHIIFRIVHDFRPTITIQTDEDGVFEPSDFSYHWIFLAHVCHHWRLVASTCAPLWTTFGMERYTELRRFTKFDQYGGSGKALAMIKNSGTLPLTLELVLDEGRDLTPAMTAALQNLGRVRVLHLFGESAARDDGAARFIFQNPAPCLEQLVFSTGEYKDESLPTLFLGDHPRLTSLALTGYKHMGNNTFSSLRQLRLSGLEYNSTDEFNELLDFLESTPELEELMFSDIGFFTGPPDINPTFRSVSLPKLQRLAFMNFEMAQLPTFFDYLSIEEDQEVAVMTSAREDDGPIEGIDLLYFMKRHFHVIDNAMTKAYIKIHENDIRSTITMAGNSHAFCFKNYNINVDETWRVMLLGRPMGRITELRIAAGENSPTFVGMMVKQMMFRASNVQSLYIDAHGHCQSYLVIAVAICFPALQDLHLRMPSGSNPDDGELFDIMVERFRIRDEEGRQPRVKRVHFYTRKFRGSKDLVQERRKQDREWKKRARMNKPPFFEEFIFHREGYWPKMELPGICTVPEGRWAWPEFE